MKQDLYDLIVVGGGPAGLTACIYGARNGLKTLLIEEFACGGQAVNSLDIKNYPGFESISGFDLAQNMEKQAKNLGIDETFEKVVDFDFSNSQKIVVTSKNKYFAKTVILAMGARERKLGLENETQLTGRGVSYCAVCDGGLYKNKTVAVVGGGNTAMEDVLYLTNLANKTYLINRSDKFRAEASYVECLMAEQQSQKVEVLNNYVVNKLVGNQKLEGLELKNSKTGELKKIDCDGLFIAIGREPNTQSLLGKVDLDEYGYVVCDKNLMTSAKGVFVAGDIRQKSLRQIVTACADGALASTNAQKYIKTAKWMKENRFEMVDNTFFERVATGCLAKVFSVTLYPKVATNFCNKQMLEIFDKKTDVLLVLDNDKSFAHKVHYKNCDIGMYFFKEKNQVFVKIFDGNGKICGKKTQSLIDDMFSCTYDTFLKKKKTVLQNYENLDINNLLFE